MSLYIPPSAGSDWTILFKPKYYDLIVSKREVFTFELDLYSRPYAEYVLMTGEKLTLSIKKIIQEDAKAIEVIQTSRHFQIDLSGLETGIYHFEIALTYLDGSVEILLPYENCKLTVGE